MPDPHRPFFLSDGTSTLALTWGNASLPLDIPGSKSFLPSPSGHTLLCPLTDGTLAKPLLICAFEEHKYFYSSRIRECSDYTKICFDLNVLMSCVF